MDPSAKLLERSEGSGVGEDESGLCLHQLINVILVLMYVGL